MSSEHIVKAYDQELTRLNNLVARMGGLAESQIAEAVQALRTRDAELGGRIIEQDTKIDDIERQIQELTVRLFALRQPMAGDLRSIVAALKISSDLERIGDYAANMAKRSIALAQSPAVKPLHTIPRMGRMVQEMIKDVLDAYMERDTEKAHNVWRRDAEVDEMYTSLFRELLTYMMEDPRNITPCTHLLFVAKNIERIGDHATNIAETIHFLVVGKMMEEDRRKEDSDAYQVMEPGP